jgi:hypothetical protein
MSTTNDLSSGPPLCRCGIPTHLRNSRTETNPGKKWYGCINYKVIPLLTLSVYISSLVAYDNFTLFLSSRNPMIVIFLSGLIRKLLVARRY